MPVSTFHPSNCGGQAGRGLLHSQEGFATLHCRQAGKKKEPLSCLLTALLGTYLPLTSPTPRTTAPAHRAGAGTFPKDTLPCFLPACKWLCYVSGAYPIIRCSTHTLCMHVRWLGRLIIRGRAGPSSQQNYLWTLPGAWGTQAGQEISGSL